jgi:hypothetical protein
MSDMDRGIFKPVVHHLFSFDLFLFQVYGRMSCTTHKMI